MRGLGNYLAQAAARGLPNLVIAIVCFYRGDIKFGVINGLLALWFASWTYEP